MGAEGRGGQSAVLQGPASSWGLLEEGEKKKEQLKVEQDGSMPRHQVSQNFLEKDMSSQGWMQRELWPDDMQVVSPYRALGSGGGSTEQEKDAFEGMGCNCAG